MLQRTTIEFSAAAARSRRRRARLVIAVCLLAGAAEAQDDSASVAAGMRACASVSAAADRLACFDTLAAALGAAPAESRAPAPAAAARAESPAAGTTAAPTEPQPAAAAAASAAGRPLDDAVGKKQTDQGESEPQVWAGRLTACERSEATSRWYFHFDNGQVWRQSNAGRLTFRECEFDVTVERDLFGYKLNIPDMDKSIRVSRVR